MRKISLYLDHPKVGCGWRSYLVLSVGPKWARLISTDTAETIKVAASELKFAREEKIKPTRARTRLRKVADIYGVDSEALKEALSVLRTGG